MLRWILPCNQTITATIILLATTATATGLPRSVLSFRWTKNNNSCYRHNICSKAHCFRSHRLFCCRPFCRHHHWGPSGIITTRSPTTWCPGSHRRPNIHRRRHYQWFRHHWFRKLCHRTKDSLFPFLRLQGEANQEAGTWPTPITTQIPIPIPIPIPIRVVPMSFRRRFDLLQAMFVDSVVRTPMGLPPWAHSV